MKLVYDNKETRELKGEVFKPYPLNNQYLASNFGRIKSKQQIVNHNHGGKAIKKERVLSQVDNGSGYLSVGLTENGKTKTIRVSRIVAITWIENELNKPQVNHIDGVKYNNYAVNLEWNTSGENVTHAWNNNLSKKQSSFIYIQQRLSKINGYLTHKLRVKTPLGFGTIIIDQNCYRIEYDNGKFENLIKSLRFWQEDFKLVLLNLSDLTKEIEVNGEKFVPIIELFQIAFGGSYTNKDVLIKYDDSKIYISTSISKLCFYPKIKGFEFFEMDFDGDDCSPALNQLTLFEKLYEWHFDIHGLIENGLAIDINTLTK